MVDNINPLSQSPEPNVSQLNQVPEASVAPVQATSFYQGFDRPNEVQVNLADSGPVSSDTPAVSQPAASPETPAQPAAPINDFRTPETPNTHEAYVGHQAEPLNWRGILFIAGLGTLTVVIFGLISYFTAGLIYGRQLTDAKNQLTSATAKLDKEKETPTALELPAAAKPPTTSTPTTTPAPVEQEIQTPATAPVTTPTGGTEANG